MTERLLLNSGFDPTDHHPEIDEPIEEDEKPVYVHLPDEIKSRNKDGQEIQDDRIRNIDDYFKGPDGKL